jgi:hypothetical protein
VNADGLMLDDMRVPELEAKLRMPVMVYNGRWADVFSKLKRKGTS